MKHSLLGFLAMILVLALPAMAAGPVVAVLPLEIYNAPELEPLSPGLQAVLASRLAGSGYRVETTSDPEAPGADWAVRTTITHLGEVYSLDVAVDPLTGGEGARSYESVNSPDGLLPAIDTLASRLRTSLGAFVKSRPMPVPVPPAVSAPATSQAPVVPAPPATAAPQQPAPVPQAPPAAPGVAPGAPASTASLQQALSNYRTGPRVEGEARSLVVTDTEGDGYPEIVLLFDGEIVAFRDLGTEIQQIWSSPAPKTFQPKILSAGDVDGNGVAELFVAGMDGTRPVSQALEWFGSAMAPKGDRMDAFVRAVNHPDDGPLLLGLVPGPGRNLFAPTIRRFTWTGSRYDEAARFAAPSSAVAMNLDYLRLARDRRAFPVVTNQGDRLEIYSPENELVFEGSESIKGTRTFVAGEERVHDYQDEDFFRVQGKTLGLDSGSGTSLIVYAKNQATLGRVFQRVASFSHGEIEVYRWDGLTMIPFARGPKLPGFFPDLDMGSNPASPGQVTLYGPLVKKGGAFFGTMETTILALDLPPPPYADNRL